MKKVLNHILPKLVMLFAFSLCANYFYAQNKEGATSEASSFLKLYGSYNKALNTNDAKELEVAEKEALELIQKEPSNDAAYILLARIYLWKNDMDKSEMFFKKAYDIDPNNFYYAISYGKALLQQKKYNEYASLMERTNEQHPKEEECYASLFDYYFSTQNADKIIALADKMEKNLGKNQVATFAKYNAYSASNQKDKAIEILLTSEDKESNPWVYAKLGDEYMQLAKDSIAESYYKKALDIESNYPNAIYGMMDITRTNDRKEEFFDYFNSYLNQDTPTAQKVAYIKFLLYSPRFYQDYADQMGKTLKEFSDKVPQDSSVAFTAAIFNAQVQKIETADTILYRTAKYYPTDEKAIMNYLSFLYTFEKWDKLLSFAKEVEGNVPDSVAYSVAELKQISEFYLKKYDGAIATLAKMEKIAKKENDKNKLFSIYSILGDIYHQKGNTKECFRYYDKALKINPENASVLNNYAWYLATDSKKRDLDRAQQMSKLAISAESSNSTFLDTYAWILYLKGDYNEAKKYLSKAIAFGTDHSSTILHHYAQCLYLLEEYDLSARYYKQALTKALSEGETKAIEDISLEIKSRNDKLNIDIELDIK